MASEGSEGNNKAPVFIAVAIVIAILAGLFIWKSTRGDTRENPLPEAIRTRVRSAVVGALADTLEVTTAEVDDAIDEDALGDLAADAGVDEEALIDAAEETAGAELDAAVEDGDIDRTVADDGLRSLIAAVRRHL